MTAATRQEQLAAIFKSAIVIPVLTIERLEDAVPLARALVAGGVRVLEVTLRTPVAAEAARAMIAEVPDAIVGIGTILNADDLARAEGARGQIRHQPRRDAGAVEGRRRKRPAVCAGDRDSFRADAGAGGRLRSRQILSRRAGRRYQGTSRAGGAVSEYQGLPDRRHWGSQCGDLAGRAECSGGGRFLALSGGRYPVRQLGRHNRHVRAGDEIAETGVKSFSR